MDPAERETHSGIVVRQTDDGGADGDPFGPSAWFWKATESQNGTADGPSSCQNKIQHIFAGCTTYLEATAAN